MEEDKDSGRVGYVRKLVCEKPSPVKLDLVKTPNTAENAKSTPEVVQASQPRAASSVAQCRLPVSVNLLFWILQLHANEFGCHVVTTRWLSPFDQISSSFVCCLGGFNEI
ncbi:hypothetical protein PoB_005693200 [Plakobranchus ocellatus]|uniref:Uncharacterized protein n=1 Tax=Plakobranchus ocellatus TaxID=259542 RepID=A0AAV4CGB8_9GAST|nr:hypothetical protein PoB_005693200 [Plakobranchus ocellatus]